MLVMRPITAQVSPRSRRPGPRNRRVRRDPAGEAPRDHRHPCGDDARHAGGILIDRRGAHRDAGPTTPEEQYEHGNDRRRHDQHRGVGLGEAQRADREVREPGGPRVDVPCAASTVDHSGEDGQELAEPERGDDAQDDRSSAQPSHDGDLRRDSGARRHAETEGQGDVVRQAPLADCGAQHGGTEGADLAVGEVDDAVRPVHEHEAHGQQPVDHSRHEAEREDAGGQLEAQDLDGEHHALTRLEPAPASARKTERSRSGRSSSSWAAPFSMK
jgi:hypothetical protein